MTTKIYGWIYSLSTNPRMRAACFFSDARAAWSGGDLRRPQLTVARHICVVLTTALAERPARNEQPQAQ